MDVVNLNNANVCALKQRTCADHCHLNFGKAYGYSVQNTGDTIVRSCLVESYTDHRCAKYNQTYNNDY